MSPRESSEPSNGPGNESVNRTPIGPGPETHGGRREPIDESGESADQALERVGDEPSRTGSEGKRKPVGDESGARGDGDDVHTGEGSEAFDSPRPRGDGEP